MPTLPIPDEDAAFSHRDTLFEFVTATRWEDPADEDQKIATVRAYAAALDEYTDGAYLNILNGVKINRAFPPAELARPATLKTVWDQANIFHLNQNIRPAGSR